MGVADEGGVLNPEPETLGGGGQPSDGGRFILRERERETIAAPYSWRRPPGPPTPTRDPALPLLPATALVLRSPASLCGRRVLALFPVRNHNY